MATAKVDHKGRVSLPREIHEILGDEVELRPLGKTRVLLTRADKGTKKMNKRSNDLVRLLDKQPKRTGRPENPSPEKMKSIWNPK